MKRQERLALLDQEARRLKQASAHVLWSLQRCAVVPASPWSEEQLERLESLGSRFARLADLLTQRLMRLADELELEAPGSLIDRIRRAEKRGWVDEDGQLVRIRELRNLIAHEYEDEDLPSLYAEVLRLAPVLCSAAERALQWAGRQA